MNPFADIFEPAVPAPLEDEGRCGFSLTLERYYSRDAAHVVVPFGATQILPEAFRGHGEIESIELPRTLESIGKAAFRDCTGLRKIAVPESVFEIGERAFSGCAFLREAALPRALMAVAPSTFSRCASLEVVHGGDEVYEVGASAFSGCGSLREMPAFSRLESLGAEAFAGCGSLSRAMLPATPSIDAALMDMAMLFATTGRTSLRDCSTEQLAAMVKAMESKGFRPIAKAGGAPSAQAVPVVDRFQRF